MNFNVNGVGEVLFVGRDQLIRMKQATGRLKDQADVQELLSRGDDATA